MEEIKKLVPYIKEHKLKIVWILFFALIASGSEGAIAVYVKPLFDNVFEHKRGDLKLVFSAMIVVIFFVNGIAKFLNQYNTRMLCEIICAKLRLDLQKKFMSLNLGYHSQNPPGVLMSKTLNDINYIQEGLGRLSSILTDPITVLALFVWILMLDWKLTVMVFVVTPLIIGILRTISRSARKYSHKQQETLERVTTIFKETFDGIRIIQSFNLENAASLRLLKSIGEYIDLRKLIVGREEAASPITGFIGACTVACVLYYTATGIINGTYTLGSFMSFMTALAIMQRPIKALQDTVVRTQVMLAATHRVFEVFDNNSVVPVLANPKPFPQNFKIIEFKNISFRYHPESPVLKNLDLKINRGEIVALVGESGSGKSTIVNLMERFYEPVTGEILIDGININQFDLKQLRQNIALVTQDVFLFDDSIETNIRFGDAEKNAKSIQTSAQLANAHDFIARTPMGYESRVGDRGARFSGGEKQRISIARAIYKDAPILVLDEATSALDSQSEFEVQKGLEQLMKGRTVLVIAHRLSTIVHADRILVLKDGEVIESGTHNELIENKGAYYNFYQLQSIAER
jgi:ATP-binding cassette subfamily B protein/subfamily B ATP-binding cassette protein MsbA